MQQTQKRIDVDMRLSTKSTKSSALVFRLSEKSPRGKAGTLKKGLQKFYLTYQVLAYSEFL